MATTAATSSLSRSLLKGGQAALFFVKQAAGSRQVLEKPLRAAD